MRSASTVPPLAGSAASARATRHLSRRDEYTCSWLRIGARNVRQKINVSSESSVSGACPRTPRVHADHVHCAQYDLTGVASMAYESYHKRKVGNRQLKPETQMMGYGYDPKLSEGALKPPVFLTSTFVFESAQDGKDFFDYTSGRREPPPGESAGLVYSRFNNPNLEVLEDRLALWESAEAALVFSSGMSAISTTLWAYLRPNDVL